MKKGYSINQWIQSYEESVQAVLKYDGYKIKPNVKFHFERLKTEYPDVNPFTFMEAMFDPNIWWGVSDRKGGWTQLKYPYPNMLTGEKAYNIHKRYVKDRKKEMFSKEQEILASISTSFDKILTLGIQLSDLEELYYLTVDGTLSPYLFLSLERSYGWYVLNCNKGALDSHWLEKFTR